MRMWGWGLGIGVAAAVLITVVPVIRRGPAARPQLMPAVSLARSAPMIARTSQLTLLTNDFDQARGAVEDILKRHRGYLGQLDVTASGDGPRTLTESLRVPADQLDPAMAEIKKLGAVESESQSGEDVTQQSVDLDARLANARNTEQRFTALLHDRTGQMTDVLAVEKEMDRVRGEIEQMETERKTLTNRVEYATLMVTLREAVQAQLSPHSTLYRFRNAASDGYATLATGVAAVLVVLLHYGPSLLLWGGISLFVIRFGWKWHRVKFGSRRVD